MTLRNTAICGSIFHLKIQSEKYPAFFNLQLDIKGICGNYTICDCAHSMAVDRMWNITRRVRGFVDVNQSINQSIGLLKNGSQVAK